MSNTCICCDETFDKNNLIHCHNQKVNIKIDQKTKKEIKTFSNCGVNYCAFCFLKEYALQKDYNFNCSCCNQLLNYALIIKVLSNCKNFDVDKYYNEIKDETDIQREDIADNCVDEFIRLFKIRILNFELSNVININCEKELFDALVKNKMDDINCFASRNEDIFCGLSVKDINDIISKYKPKKESEYFYYNSYVDLFKTFNDQTLKLVNEIETILNKLYELKISEDELLNKYKNDIDTVIQYKKTFVNIASDIIYKAKLIGDVGVKNVIEFIFPCPKHGCYGYICKDTNKCNVCNSWACKKCRSLMVDHKLYNKEIDEKFDRDNKINHEVKDYIYDLNNNQIQELNNIIINYNNANKDNKKELFKLDDKGHCLITCDRNTYESMKLIASDSKPCPTCGIYIKRTLGCNQMFCTNCHNCFDWISLQKMDAKLVHNPLLIDYLAKVGQNIDFSDIKCDIVEDDKFLPLLSKVIDDDKTKTLIKQYYRKHNELKDYVGRTNTRGLSNDINALLKHFIVSKNTYCVFDMDYSRDKKQTSEWERREIYGKDGLKEKLYKIYDEIFGKNIFLEYYQLLAQGMNDTFLIIQADLLKINELAFDGKRKKVLIGKNKLDVEKYLNEVNNSINEIIKWYDEMKNIIEENEKILNPKYSLNDLEIY